MGARLPDNPNPQPKERFMKYDLRKPCDLCPFRNDSKRLYVPPERLEEMARGEFCCHKTGESNDETGEINPTEKSQHCAGMLIMREKMEEPHQMMRICERLGLYDHTKLDMDSPVFESWEEVEDAEDSILARQMRGQHQPQKAR